MYCGKSVIPLGSKVKIICNFEGNKDEPFVGKYGIATNPFPKGCKKQNWIGVILCNETIYGRKFNFHVNEVFIVKELGNDEGVGNERKIDFDFPLIKL